MDSVSLDNITVNYRPLKGRVLLEIEPLPASSPGGIVIPDTARDQKVTDTSMFARVIAVGYGDFYEMENGKLKRCNGLNPEVCPIGSRVRFRCTMDDMNAKRIITSVLRIDAVVEEE